MTLPNPLALRNDKTKEEFETTGEGIVVSITKAQCLSKFPNLEISSN